MQTMNGYLRVQPVKQGIMAVEGNEYRVMNINNNPIEEFGFQIGDIIVVEDHMVVRTVIKGMEEYFVKEDNVLARISQDECS